MPRPNECDECPHFDMWLQVCAEVDWGDNETARYCYDAGECLKDLMSKVYSERCIAIITED